MALIKHRRASPRFSVDFASSLPSGVSISSIDAVVISRKDTVNGVLQWVDVTAEFWDPTDTAGADFPEPASIVSGSVRFRLGEVATDDANSQARGRYQLRVDVTLSDAQKWTHTGIVEVIDTGDEFVQ